MSKLKGLRRTAQECLKYYHGMNRLSFALFAVGTIAGVVLFSLLIILGQTAAASADPSVLYKAQALLREPAGFFPLLGIVLALLSDVGIRYDGIEIK